MPFPIFKNPKDGGFKKSQKGCCIVGKAGDTLTYRDGYTWEEAQIEHEDYNLLRTIFKDGKMVYEQTLADIRNVLHEGKF